MIPCKLFLIYFIIISFLGAIITIYDKIASKKRIKRISEIVLFGVGIMGGALVMFLTMRLIHHKTRHRSFMKGFPVIFLLQFIFLIINADIFY